MSDGGRGEKKMEGKRKKEINKKEEKKKPGFNTLTGGLGFQFLDLLGIGLFLSLLVSLGSCYIYFKKKRKKK